MKVYRNPVVFLTTVFLAAALGLCLGGCGMLEKLEAASTAAQAISNDAGKVIAETQAAIEKLPVGDPVRVALEEKLKKVKSVRDDADKYIVATNATIKSIKDGAVSPELSAALGAVPYGSYVAIALSLGLAIQRTMKGSQVMDAFGKLVKSWHEVGPELSKEEKVQVAAIQGEEVTRLVHEVKGRLGL